MSIGEENKTLGKKLVSSHSFVYVIYNLSKQEICGKVEYVASPLPPFAGIQDHADMVEEEYSTWV